MHALGQEAAEHNLVLPPPSSVCGPVLDPLSPNLTTHVLTLRTQVFGMVGGPLLVNSQGTKLWEDCIASGSPPVGGVTSPNQTLALLERVSLLVLAPLVCCVGVCIPNTGPAGEGEALRG